MDEGRGLAFRPARIGVCLLTACLLCTMAPVAGAAEPAATPALRLALRQPPAEPEVAPAAPEVAPFDRSRNRVDDRIDATLARAAELAAAGDLAGAAALRDERVELNVVFRRQVTAEQLQAFAALGGEFRHVFTQTQYGWIGTIARGQVPALPAALGDSLAVVSLPLKLIPMLDEATQTGRVRLLWRAGGLNETSRAYDGSDEADLIKAVIIDTGIDETHPDMPTKITWSAPTAITPAPVHEDQLGHGTHMASILAGNGDTAGLNPSPLNFTISGNLRGVDGGIWGGAIHLPTGLETITWDSTVVTAVLPPFAPANTPGTLLQLFRKDGFKQPGVPYEYSSVGQADGPLNQLSLSSTITKATPGTNYNASLRGNNLIEQFTIRNSVTYQGVGDGFNAFRGVAPGLDELFVACVYNGLMVSEAWLKIYLDTWIQDRIDAAKADTRPKEDFKIALLSMGIDTDGLDYGGGTAVTKNGINTLTSYGALTVVAAGNNRPGHTAMTPPALTKYALTVGSVNDNNQLTDYSLPGPTTYDAGTEDAKPDVLAPGGSNYYSHIMAADSNTADCFAAIGDAQADDYANAYGTSQAAAFAAGVATLMVDVLQGTGVKWSFKTNTDALRVKWVLCMTASETNDLREGLTVADAGNPVLDRSGGGGAGAPLGYRDINNAVVRTPLPKDRFEGFGMINPDAATEALTVSVNPAGVVNADTGRLEATRISGTADGKPTGRRCWARNVALVAGTPLDLVLASPKTGDFDVYLFSNAHDGKGNPMMLASSTIAGGAGVVHTDTIHFDPDVSETAYIVVKRVSGTGTWTLDVSSPTLTVDIAKTTIHESDVLLSETVSSVEIRRNFIGFAAYANLSAAVKFNTLETTGKKYLEVWSRYPDPNDPLAQEITTLFFEVGQLAQTVYVKGHDVTDPTDLEHHLATLTAFVTQDPTKADDGYISGSDTVWVFETEIEVPTLEVTVSEDQISENGGVATGVVTRRNAIRLGPNAIATPLNVRLESNDESEALPQASNGGQVVTIPAGEVSALFDVIGVPDGTRDGTQKVAITAIDVTNVPPLYQPGMDTLEVTDDEKLTLTVTKVELTEGQSTTATVSRSTYAETGAQVVTLTSSDTSEVTVPATVTIAANEMSATFDVQAVRDFVNDGDQVATITVSATGFIPASQLIKVIDSDRSLEVQIVADAISEHNGTTVANVLRNQNSYADPLDVQLTSSDDSRLCFRISVAGVPTDVKQTTVTFAANQQLKVVDLVAVDNKKLEGTKTVTIRASAAGFAEGMDTVDITDYETLSLTIDGTTTAEVYEQMGVYKALGRVTRNNTDDSPFADLAVTVSLVSSDTTQLRVPATVTIEKGQGFVDFDVMAVDDGLNDGDRWVTVTATAPNYVNTGDDLAKATVEVLDNNRDLVVYATVEQRQTFGQGVQTTLRVQGYAIFEVVTGGELRFSGQLEYWKQGKNLLYRKRSINQLTSVSLFPEGGKTQVVARTATSGDDAVIESWVVYGARGNTALGNGASAVVPTKLAGQSVGRDTTDPADPLVTVGSIAYRLDPSHTAKGNTLGYNGEVMLDALVDELTKSGYVSAD